MRHLAEVHVRLNNTRAAQRFSSASWVIMEKANDRVELGALSKIKAILAERTGEKEESVRLYARAIDQLDETGVRFEKADALIMAGKSQSFTIRQRLTYLFRAEEFYSRFGIRKKREEIERLINEIDDHGTRPSPVQVEASSRATRVDYITSSPEIIAFKKQLPLIAGADLPLLLTGETGVGKDHMARYFHQLSRPDAPFVAINCASLPETLLESELFGYRKGAFTGAEANKQGLFVAANGGVLFLDEIGDMPVNLQTKLLGVLENRKVVPLGSTVPVDLDIKLIAATNKNLEEMVEAGTFRRDLYYRLSGVTFEIPPLRNRKEDIPLLLSLFMEKCKLSKEGDSIPADLARQFIEYDWPGNTRELYNKVKRLEVMSQLVAEGDLVELSRSIFDSDMPATANSLFERVEQFERKIILEALLAAQGNKSEAARMLGIHEATVRMKLKRYGISLEQFH
jgi:transcriptional regulator with PAS, ATPase and Fis domain